MPKITALSAQKRLKNRVNIHLDGKYAFSLNLDTVMEKGLKVGDEISEKELETLIIESEREKVINKILNFLSYRPRSKKEIKDRLYKYTSPYGEHQDKLQKVAFDYLQNQDLVNDYEFSLWFISQRAAHRPRSLTHLASELYSKGISKTIIDKAIKDSGYDTQEALQDLIDKKLKSTDLNPETRQKLITSLLRKGFRYDEIKNVIKKYEQQKK